MIIGRILENYQVKLGKSDQVLIPEHSQNKRK